MRKLFKFISSMVLLNFIFCFFLLGWINISILKPSLEGTGITITDLFKKNLDPIKYKKLEANISIQSEKLGKNTAKKLFKIFEAILPAADFDYSKMPASKYPYPSVDEVLKLYNQKAQVGIEQGLEYVDDMDK